MSILSSKIFFVSIIALLLCGVFSFSKTALAQTSVTSSSETVENSNEVTSTAPVYSPNEVTPESGMVSSSNGGTILENLRIFGQDIGMSYVDPRTILARIIKSGMSFIGIIVLVIILWTGLRLMLSGGDEEKSQHAKKTFWNMLIGLFIILSAYSIITFVFNMLNNTNTDNSDPISLPSSPTSPVIRDPVVNP